MEWERLKGRDRSHSCLLRKSFDIGHKLGLYEISSEHVKGAGNDVVGFPKK